MTEYLYRVDIISQPEWEERWCFVTDHDGVSHFAYYPCPVGWEPSGDYIKRFDSDRWIEPALDKAWRSRSAAASRRDLLNNAGYLAIVQRSAPIKWPADGEEKVNTPEGKQVAAAIRVLKRAGLIESADDLIK